MRRTWPGLKLFCPYLRRLTMAQSKTVTPTWGDQQFPEGTAPSTGAVLTLRKSDGTVQDTQTVPLESGAVSFSVPTGTGWYVQGQTVAGTAALGAPVQTAPFDVAE